ncbi:MAG: MBL fold metallo-hydrolase [Nitrososphaerota archaeon]|nr:MBL fold metallo-hydrolase [Nitrososphaerota archaeon]
MEVAAGIHRIEGVRGANAYLVVGGEGAVVVDAGMPGNEGRIVGYAKGAGVEPGAIRYIVLTHPDIDHSGSVAKLKGLTGAKVAIHEADGPRLAGEKKLKEVRGAAGVLFGLASPFMRFTPVKPDVLLKDGDRVDGLVVIHTPGHTDGSICLYKEGEAIFVGDALRTGSGGEPLLPPGSMTADMQRAKESVKKIAGYRYEVLLPGHGPPITRDASKVMAGFAETSA